MSSPVNPLAHWVTKNDEILFEELIDAVRLMKGRDLVALIAEATVAAALPVTETLGFFEEMEAALTTEVAGLKQLLKEDG